MKRILIGLAIGPASAPVVAKTIAAQACWLRAVTATVSSSQQGNGDIPTT